MHFECADAASLQASSDMVITLGDEFRDDSDVFIVDNDIFVEREDVNRNVVRMRSGRRPPLRRGVATMLPASSIRRRRLPTTLVHTTTDGRAGSNRKHLPVCCCVMWPPHQNSMHAEYHNLASSSVP
jgi:hypothetical protein